MELINPIHCPIELRGSLQRSSSSHLFIALFIDTYSVARLKHLHQETADCSSARNNLYFFFWGHFWHVGHPSLGDLKVNNFISHHFREHHLREVLEDWYCQKWNIVEPHDWWGAQRKSEALDEILIRRRREGWSSAVALLILKCEMWWRCWRSEVSLARRSLLEGNNESLH